MVEQETIKIEKNQKEGFRELIRYQYTESNKSSEWQQSYNEEGSLWYPQYSLSLIHI